MRASIRRESQQRRLRERAHQRGVNTSYLEGDYDEDEEDDNEISLASIKKQFKPGARKGKFLTERACLLLFFIFYLINRADILLSQGLICIIMRLTTMSYDFNLGVDPRPNIYSSDSEEDSDFDEEKESRHTKKIVKKLEDSDEVSIK